MCKRLQLFYGFREADPWIVMNSSTASWLSFLICLIRKSIWQRSLLFVISHTWLKFSSLHLSFSEQMSFLFCNTAVFLAIERNVSFLSKGKYSPENGGSQGNRGKQVTLICKNRLLVSTIGTKSAENWKALHASVATWQDALPRVYYLHAKRFAWQVRQEPSSPRLMRWLG